MRLSVVPLGPVAVLLAAACTSDPGAGAGSTSAATTTTAAPTTVDGTRGSASPAGSSSSSSSSTEAPGGDASSGGGSGTGGTSGTADSGSSSSTGGQALGDPQVFRTLDEADVCGPTPAAACTPGDLGWLASEYGTEFDRADDGWVDASKGVYRLVAFSERVGPSSIDVYVADEDNLPLTGVTVAFYYDSAPTPSRPDEWYPVKVEAVTDASGRAGFALGAGAYLDDCGGGGPHAIWISEPGADPDTSFASDLVDRLGMLGGTDHRHLDLHFARVPPGGTPLPIECEPG